MKTKLVLLFILTAVLMACSPVSVRYFPGAPRFAPTPPDTVDLLRHEPRRPHIAFAEIVYDPPYGVSRREVEWVLRERGARLGADAVVVQVDNLYHESVWVGPWGGLHRRVYREHIIVGIAIRYH